jgi:hypothetical protein
LISDKEQPPGAWWSETWSCMREKEVKEGEREGERGERRAVRAQRNAAEECASSCLVEMIIYLL